MTSSASRLCIEEDSVKKTEEIKEMKSWQPTI
jgi:hypothetical protein